MCPNTKEKILPACGAGITRTKESTGREGVWNSLGTLHMLIRPVASGLRAQIITRMNSQQCSN